MERTHFESTGLVIIVTDAQAAAQHASCDAIFLSIKDAMPVADIGLVSTQIDLTLAGEGTYFFDPDGSTQEALEAFERGEMIPAGRYFAHRRYDEREEER